jgi:hypothetical protein
MMDQGLISQERRNFVSAPTTDDELVFAGGKEASAESHYHASSIGPCLDLPIYQMPIFQKVFAEVEPEQAVTPPVVKEKEKVNFLRMMAGSAKAKVANMLKRIRDTISTFKESSVTYFSGAKPANPKKAAAPVKQMSAVSKAVVSKKMDIAGNESVKAPVPVKSKVDFEQARIDEIERESAIYTEELGKVGSDNSRKLMELVYKILYLAGSLAKRQAKLETRKYQEELEKNVKERQKTYENGRGWTVFSVVVNGVSAGFSFLPIAGGFMKASAPVTARVFQQLGKTTQALSGFGSAAGKFDDIGEAKNTSARLGHERYKEVFDEVIRNMKSSEDKVSGLSQELLSMWKELNRSETSTKKQAIGGQ